MSQLDIKINGTIMDNESADIMRYWGYNDVTCPADIESKLDEAAESEEITLYINSGGGSLMAGHDIYCLLRKYTGVKTAHIQSLAASAATIPMMACNKRTAEVVSMVCIHNPSSFAYGDQNEFRKVAEDLDAFKNSILNAYQSVLKLSREEISALMNEDKMLDANQALEYGIIDEIIGDAQEAEPFRIVAAAGGYMFPTPEMKKQYQQHIENSKKELELQALRLKILSK